MAEYAYWAMNISNAELIINKLIQFKIIRYASYKQRLMLFQGTDMDLEAEIDKAGVVVSRPIVFIDDLNLFFNKRISPVKPIIIIEEHLVFLIMRFLRSH